MRKIDPARQQERRRQILAAAAECFAENGFHATSTAQICARAGMSPGNLFHYYASKAEIIEALIASDTDTLREHRQAAAGDARAALIGWVGGETIVNDNILHDYAAGHPWLHYVAALAGAVFVVGVGKYLQGRRASAAAA